MYYYRTNKVVCGLFYIPLLLKCGASKSRERTGLYVHEAALSPCQSTQVHFLHPWLAPFFSPPPHPYPCTARQKGKRREWTVSHIHFRMGLPQTWARLRKACGRPPLFPFPPAQAPPVSPGAAKMVFILDVERYPGFSWGRFRNGGSLVWSTLPGRDQNWSRRIGQCLLPV